MRRLINFLRGRNNIPKPGGSAEANEGLWNRIMTRHLLLFNTVSSGVLMMFGDIAAQTIETKLGEREPGLDLKRVARMATVGTIQGPMHHYFYTWVDRIIPTNTHKSVFNKIMLDQFIASPLFICSYFYPAGLMEGHSLEECNEELWERKFWTVYKVDWIVWPPAQAINFYFLPLRYRVLYINAITTMYNVFLCYIKHKVPKKPKVDEQAAAN